MPTHVYIRDSEGIKRYPNIVDAIHISDTTIRVMLDDGRKAKKDGRLFGAEYGDIEAMVGTRTYTDVHQILTMPNDTVHLKIGKRDVAQPVGMNIRRIKVA